MGMRANDKGYSPGNRTPPRTEIRIQGLDYHTGAWQMEAEVYVPKGTSGASLMQVHGGKGVSSTVMVRIYDGEMILLLVLVKFIQIAVADEDPTKGFTEVPLKPSNFVLQKPFDIPLDKRYSFIDGVHRMWVYSDDKPFNPSTHTMPRTEIRIAGLDYSSGVWQFEGEGYVPRGTSGATVAQIHGASHGATTLILRIYAPGEMRYYNSLHVADGMYDRWFKLNIVHDVDGGTVTVYLDGEKKFQHHDQGPGDLYFKCGVYGAPSGMSHYMESRWKNIKIYKK
ncbi:Citrate-binding protein [Linum grandiflorum]